jgi:hypothetical protein
MNLGDAWGREPAAPETSPFAMDYYRQKATEFQATLNALDKGYSAANAALASGALDDESQASIVESLDEYEGKRTMLKVTAEAINAGAAVINSLGGRFPQLSLPSTLGALPAVPIALIAAIGTAAGLIAWGSQWLTGLNERLKRAQLIEGATPSQRDALIRAMQTSDAASTEAQSGVLAAIAPAVKWIALGVLGFLAYRAFMARK